MYQIKSLPPCPPFQPQFLCFYPSATIDDCGFVIYHKRDNVPLWKLPGGNEYFLEEL